MLSVTEVALTLSALILSYQWSKTSRLTIPRVGPPTIFGYAWTALRFTFKPVEVMYEAKARFGGRPYVLPSLGGSWIVLSGDDIEFLRSSDDSTVSIYRTNNWPGCVEESDFLVQPASRGSRGNAVAFFTRNLEGIESCDSCWRSARP